MKLTDIQTKPSQKSLNRVTESIFGFKIDYDAITYPKALKMSKKIVEAVSKIRQSSMIHTAERDPQYLEMLIVYEGLQRWLDAYTHQRRLVEGELGQAETMLAAKDMVDSCQDMIEKVGKMQNEELPALIDSIRDQLGIEQADMFKNSVGQVLATLTTQLSATREQLDNAARSLAGEGGTADTMSMGGAGGEMGMEEPPTMGGEEGGGIDDTDGFDATDAAAGGQEELGREYR